MSMRLFSKLSVRGKMALAILLVGACVFTAGDLTYRSITQLDEASDWTDHTFLVLIALGELEAELNQIETNQRGYILSADPSYLAPNAELRKTVVGKLAALGEMTSDNAVQRFNMAQLSQLVPARLQVMNDALELYQREGLAAAILRLQTNQGKNVMDGIHRVLADMGREERRLLVLRRADEENQRHSNNNIILGSAAITLLFVGFIALLIGDDTAVRRRLRETVERLALTDALTGLPNRAAFDARLEAAFARARRNQRNVAILLIDLDGFKAVNDGYGRLAGDQVLHLAAARVKAILRASDVFARFRGDEFMGLIDELPARADAATVASKIIEALSRPFEFHGGTASISASVGISLFPEDDTRPEELVQFANEAMQKAKQAGKARFRFFARRDAETEA